MKSCGISAANKNGAGFHFLPIFLCFFYVHISFRKCEEAMLITWTAVKCASVFTSHATGCDSSPESLRHLRNSAVLNLCFRLKLNQTNRAGSKQCSPRWGRIPVLIRQDNMLEQLSGNAFGSCNYLYVFNNLTNNTLEAEMCVCNAAQDK